MNTQKFSSPSHQLLIEHIFKVTSTTKTQISIVDYGCGEGELLQYLPYNLIKEYKGFDINAASISTAQKRWKNLKKASFYTIDRKHLPRLGNKKKVDVIFLVGVIQYLPPEDLDHVVNESQRILKNGGYFLASCASDHSLYKWLNIYRIFLANHFIKRQSILSILTKNKFIITESFERGLLLAPLFSNVIVFFFDLIDKLIFKTKGNLGPVGRKVRTLFSHLIREEFKIPIDFGYTLFIFARKLS